MPQACCFIRHTASYQAACFVAGLERHGFTIVEKWQREPEPDDLLLLWNRNRSFDPIAEVYERAGARLLIAENGYLGCDADGRKLYALARNHHVGAGSWYVGPEPRRAFDLKPWRERGDHIVLLPQRGIGPRGIAMPHRWAELARKRLSGQTRRPIVIRRHPGANKADPWPDLKGAHCAVTWASSAGIKALAHGIPVFHELPQWIGAPAARLGTDDIENCHMGDRGPMLHRLSWAQWSIAEIKSGEAFERLLHG